MSTQYGRIGGDSACCTTGCCVSQVSLIAVPVSAGTIGLCTDCGLVETDTPGGWNDKLDLSVFGSSGATITPAVSSTSDLGSGITINGPAFTLGVVGVDYSVDACGGTMFALQSASDGPYTFNFDSARRVCRVTLPVADNHFGGRTARVEAWDNAGGYYVTTGSISTSSFTPFSCGEGSVDVTAANGTSITQVRFQWDSPIGGDVGIGFGRLSLCTQVYVDILRLLEDGGTRTLEDGTSRRLEKS